MFLSKRSCLWLALTIANIQALAGESSYHLVFSIDVTFRLLNETAFEEGSLLEPTLIQLGSLNVEGAYLALQQQGSENPAGPFSKLRLAHWTYKGGLIPALEKMMSPEHLELYKKLSDGSDSPLDEQPGDEFTFSYGEPQPKGFHAGTLILNDSRVRKVLTEEQITSLQSISDGLPDENRSKDFRVFEGVIRDLTCNELDDLHRAITGMSVALKSRGLVSSALDIKASERQKSLIFNVDPSNGF